MTCARCNDTRRVTEPGADPCATPEEVWCPECANPPPPFVPEVTGFYWVSYRQDETWEPALVIISNDGPAASSVMQIGSDLPRSIADYEFGPKIEQPEERVMHPSATQYWFCTTARVSISPLAGDHLDYVAGLNGLVRAEGEPDDAFRARLGRLLREAES